jgi:MFS family permease
MEFRLVPAQCGEHDVQGPESSRANASSFHPFSANRTALTALLAANAISLAGNQITLLAIPWYVLASGGSASDVGLVGVFTFLPTIIATFFGGGLVDRFPRKQMSIAADLASGLAVAMIPLLDRAIGLAFWQLLALVFLGALLDAPGNTARQSLLPDLADRAGVPNERASSAYQTVHRLSTLLGPVAGGLLIAAVGATNVLWIDAASFAVSALIVGIALPADRPQPRVAARYARELLDGLRFIRGERLMLWLAMYVMLFNFIDAPFGVLLPVMADNWFGSARALGFMAGALGAGGVAGGILYGVIGPRLPRRGTFITAYIICSLPIPALALTPPLWVCCLLLFSLGVAGGPLNPILMVVRQERVPSDLRGRVFGTFSAIAYLTIPAGTLAGGLLISAFGEARTLMLMACGHLLISVTMIWNRNGALTTMERPEAVPAAVETPAMRHG